MQIEVSTILTQAGATLSGLVSRTQDLVSKLKALQLDRQEFVCLKYLVLFNPGEIFDVLYVTCHGTVVATAASFWLQMWSLCRAAGRWSRLRSGWTELWWSTLNSVTPDTPTSSANFCCACLRCAASACRWRSICISATFWGIYPATLYSPRCCTPNTADMWRVKSLKQAC